MDLNLFIQDLKDLVKYNSVQAEPSPNMPFGKEVNGCLLTFLEIANRFGFETINYNGYAGEVVFGQGEEFGILCHLDIVPAGSLKDWDTPPFDLTLKKDKLIGRGVLDNKGPALIILHALNELKQEGFVPNKKIRLILGCNEESGWECINHLKSLNKMPNFGFSPDADFPVIYAEKGIMHVEFSFDSKPLTFLKGGSAYNMVCDKVEFTPNVINDDLLEKYSLVKEGNYLVSYGKTAHASNPTKGVNAIKRVLEYLQDTNCVSQEIKQKLFDNYTNILSLQDETGHLTLSPDLIIYQNGKIKILCDIRYPSTLPYQKVLQELQKIAPYEIKGHQPPIFLDKNCNLVQTLIKVYNQETNQNARPISIGGGTYARSMPNCVAFGPVFTNEDGVCHQPNEYMKIQDLLLAFKIYKKAITVLS